MPITIQYGPIAGALGLAAVAGRGQGFALQSQRDLQALQIQNQMQSEIDRNNATEMQNAMAYQQLQSNQQDRQAQLAQQASYQNAELALRNQGLSDSEDAEDAQQQQQQNALAEKQREFDAQQPTREQASQSLAALRAAQAAQVGQPTQAGTIAANGAVLRSMDQQATQTQQQIQKLTAALAKAQDPYTGDPQQAAAITQQLSGLQFSLDGVDPSTGEKVQQGLNDKRDALRGYLQSYGSRLKPGATMTPSDDGQGYDLDNTDGVDDSDPLYQVNASYPAVQRVGMTAQSALGTQMQQQAGMPGQMGSQQGGQQATPAMIAQLGQTVAQKMGATSVSDPAVKNAVRQLLAQQGITIPTIQ